MQGIRLCLVVFLSAAIVVISSEEIGQEVDLVQVSEKEEIARDTGEEEEDEEIPEFTRGSDKFKKTKCPLFEEYMACGPTCQITCNTLGSTCPAGACVPGCFCKAGTVRSTHGTCILQKSCHSKLKIFFNS